MKLNADIIYKELSKTIRLDCYGVRKKELLLQRPIFWLGGKEMMPDRLYVVRSDLLPKHTQIQEGDLIICVGGNPLSDYCDESFALFVVKDSDILTIHNLLQEIFDRYDGWEKAMQEIVEEDRGLQQLVDCSDEFLGAPAMILDNRFCCLAYSSYVHGRPEYSDLQPENGVPNVDGISASLERYGTSNMTRHDVFIIENAGLNQLAKNIFDHDSYAGSMFVSLLPGQKTEPVAELTRFFFTYAEKLFRRTVMHAVGYPHILKSALLDLIDCYPVDPIRMKSLQSGVQDTFICMKLRLTEQMLDLSLDYFCVNLEILLSGCIAFRHESDVVAFLNMTKMKCSPESAVSQALNRMPSMKVKVGVSNPFHDLTKVRFYFQEASVALKMGKMLSEAQNAFHFNDYILPYILMQGTGEFPLDVLFQEYFGSLQDHDQNSPISYLETLRCYIRNNMNVLKTAEALFVHRSTLNSRLVRIKQMIKLDWNKADDFLILTFLLRAQDIYISS